MRCGAVCSSGVPRSTAVAIACLRIAVRVAVSQAHLPHLHAHTRGLDFDRAAVNALTLPFHNGGTEGVNTKPK